MRITRRSFLAGMGAGLVIGVHFAHADEPSGQQGPQPRPGSEAVKAEAAGLAPNVLVYIAPDGATTSVCTRSEMGQGVRSSIPVLIADELGADWSRVTVRQADGDKKYGDQNTDGSNSIRGFYDDLRRIGATGRVLLVTAAATSIMRAAPPARRS